MTFWERLYKTFQDKDGSIALTEVNTAAFALVCLCCAVANSFGRALSFPYVSVCAACVAINLAYAGANRIRDGLWKPGDP